MSDQLSEYRQLLTDLDRFGEMLAMRFPVEITCHLGCTGCCQQHLSVFQIEAENLRAFISSLPEKRQAELRERARATLAREADFAARQVPPPDEFPPEPERAIPCPALIDNACSIYEARPVICRTHGFPLLYIDEEAEEALLDVCPLNFSESEDDLDALTRNDVFEMNLVNERLVTANIAHLKATVGHAKGSLERTSMAEIILAATADLASTQSE
jgi:Fe-S-cluster containining protein